MSFRTFLSAVCLVAGLSTTSLVLANSDSSLLFNEGESISIAFLTPNAQARQQALALPGFGHHYQHVLHVYSGNDYESPDHMGEFHRHTQTHQGNILDDSYRRGPGGNCR